MRAGRCPALDGSNYDLLEHFFGVEVDLFRDGVLNAWIGAHRQTLGSARDEVELAACVAGFSYSLSYDLSGPAREVDCSAVDSAHEGDLSAVLLYQLGDVVGVHYTLPYVDAHVDHVGNERCRVGVGVMNYQLYAVALVVSVDLLVSRLIELSEHLRGDERGDLGTPVPQSS